METTLRTSTCDSVRQSALETFDSVLREIHAQHCTMQDALNRAQRLPLSADEDITCFLDTRDALATKMTGLGEALYHALTTGHADELSSILAQWSSDSPQNQPSARRTSAASDGRLSSESVDSASPPIGSPFEPPTRLDLLTVPSGEEAPLDSALHLHAAERMDAAASFRASSAKVMGVDALAPNAMPVDADEAPAILALETQADDAGGSSALDLRPESLSDEFNTQHEAVAHAVNEVVLPAKESASTLSITEIEINEDADRAEKAEAQPTKKSSPRIVTRVASPAAKPKAVTYQPISLDSLVKPMEGRRVIAEVTPAPPSRPATVDEALLNRLNGNLGVKDFVEKLPDHVPHHFIENKQLTQTQLEQLEKTLKELMRPPLGSISNFQAYVGALHAFTSPNNLESFADLSQELCLSVMKVVVAYHRFLQDDDKSNAFADDLKKHWTTIATFKYDYNPGYVSGMVVNSPPDVGPTWRDATRARIAELERQVGEQLKSVKQRNAESSQTKREKQSKIDIEFNKIERIIQTTLKDLRLAEERAGLEKKIADRANDTTSTQLNRRNHPRTARKPEALVHGRTLDEAKTFRDANMELISAGLLRLLEIGCRPDHPRLLDSVTRLRDLLDLTGPLQPIQDAIVDKQKVHEQVKDEPEHTTKSWPFRDQITEGKKAFIVGGERRTIAEDRIKEHFGFSEVKWLSTNSSNKGKKQLTAVQRGMRDGRYDFYIAIENLVAHAWTWMIFGEERADNVQPVLISGYGVRAIELELERTMRLHADKA